MRLAFIGGLLFAILAPLIGQYMVFRGYSGISDGISHIALVGIVVGLIIGQFSIIWALIITIGLSFVLEYLRNTRALRAETAIALFVVLSLSTISILKQSVGITKSLESLLFGSITSISLENIWWIAGVGLISIVLVVINYRKLMSITFSEELSRVNGLKVGLWNYVMIALVAVTVVVGIDVIGGLLVASLMIVPVAAASQFEMGFKSTHVLSVCFSIASLVLGLMLSWVLDFPAGSTIALVSCIMFGLSFVVNLKPFSLKKVSMN